MKNYKLLTPGPLTTSESVKKEMLFDYCTWDDEYKAVTQTIRAELLRLANVKDDYTCVLMQGSGSFGVESVLSSVVKDSDKILVCTNGEYGRRIAEICRRHKLNTVVYDEKYDKIISDGQIEAILNENPDITHIAMVHCETTTGILNDIEKIGELCYKYNKTFIVDAMSSFGGIPIDMNAAHIDFLISSANKCIQGVPGFSFVLANKQKLMESAGAARTLSLDLYDQWEGMDKDGKWRFTSPTHAVMAFSKALKELEAEGGISKRFLRYTQNNRLLIDRMKSLGINAYVDSANQSPIITTFYFPKGDFSFFDMYLYIKNRGYAIYPGKLTDADTFRIGNIGEIYLEDIEKLYQIIKDYLESRA